MVSRTFAEADAVAAEIVRAGGIAIAFAADISKQVEAEAMARAAVEAWGGIDILCANAGIYPAVKLGTMTEADFDRVIGTNLKGCVLSVQACLPAMNAAGTGRIILTSSITGPITGYPGWSHYGASKAGQLGFMHRTGGVHHGPGHGD